MLIKSDKLRSIILSVINPEPLIRPVFYRSFGWFCSYFPAPSQSAWSCRYSGISSDPSCPSFSRIRPPTFNRSKYTRHPSKVRHINYIDFAPKEIENFLKVLWHHGFTLLYFNLHELVDFVLPFHVFLEFDLQIVLLFLDCFLLLGHQVRIGLLEVLWGLVVLKKGELRFFLKWPLLLCLFLGLWMPKLSRLVLIIILNFYLSGTAASISASVCGGRFYRSPNFLFSLNFNYL